MSTEKQRAYGRKHWALFSERHPERVKELNRLHASEYRKRNPHKIRARRAVYMEIRAKRLFPKDCESCGAETTEAHHDDYSKPLEVVWLCRKCHRERESTTE